MHLWVLYLYLYVSGIVYVLLNQQPVISKAGCSFLGWKPETFPVTMHKETKTDTSESSNRNDKGTIVFRKETKPFFYLWERYSCFPICSFRINKCLVLSAFFRDVKVFCKNPECQCTLAVALTWLWASIALQINASLQFWTDAGASRNYLAKMQHMQVKKSVV